MTNLTDKWKQGKLLNGIYWVKYKNGFIDMEEYIGHHNGFCYEEKELIKEVLDEVPSYESWKKHKKVTAETQIKNCDLEIINTKLKELLKECKHIMVIEKDFASCHFEKHKLDELLAKIDQVLGEE